MSDTNFMSYSDAETVVTGIADKYKTFKGTQAQWDALSLSEKVKYSFADITDDYAGTGVVDAVTNGDMNPVTSNAVYDYTREAVEVTADGTETWSELFIRLRALIDMSKVGSRTRLSVQSTGAVYTPSAISDLNFVFTKSVIGSSIANSSIETWKVIIKLTSTSSFYGYIKETFNSSGVVTASLIDNSSTVARGKVALLYR